MNSEKQKAIFKVIFSGRMLVAFFMGFSSGLPLLLTMGVLQAWMKESGVDLTTIGLVALVQIPYTWKFFWAPFMDRFVPPFLGRRRGWLLISQIALVCAIAGLGRTDPVNHFGLMVAVAILVAFFSASQDIVVDAYRREDLPDEELGFGSSMYINGYRVGMLLASGGGMIFANYLPFSSVYLIMAFCMLPGIATTLLCKEPMVTAGAPKTMTEAVIGPLTDYFGREDAFWMLGFILLYKIGDTMASAMTTPFFLDIGFSLLEIGTVVKFFGFAATVAGTLLGGALMIRIGINRSLWVFGILQGVSTAGFAVLARIGHSIPALSGAVALENLCTGMGTSAFVAFMASITNKKFTATQYALLSSLMGIPRVLASAPTGYLAKHMGWETFFLSCVGIAVPGLLLLLKFAPWSRGVTETAAE